MTGILDGVLEGYVLFAELVLWWVWAGEVYGGDGGWVGGSDGGLLGWGAVEGVLEDTCVDRG